MHDATAAALGGYVMIFIALGIPCGLFCAWLASQKGHNEMLWFFGGLIFSVLALIAIAGAPDRAAERTKRIAEGAYVGPPGLMRPPTAEPPIPLAPKTWASNPGLMILLMFFAGAVIWVVAKLIGYGGKP